MRDTNSIKLHSNPGEAGGWGLIKELISTGKPSLENKAVSHFCTALDTGSGINRFFVGLTLEQTQAQNGALGKKNFDENPNHCPVPLGR